MGILMPIATAGIALVVGALVGGGIAWVAKPPEIVEKLVPRDLNAEEIAAVCAPSIAEVTAQLTQAEDKVTTLLDDVKGKEAKVKSLEDEMAERAKKGAKMRAGFEAELAAAEAELTTVKEQLKTALEEKEQLVVDLKKTIKELDAQKEETKVAKEDALEKGWSAFLGESQLEVCDRGNRKKLGHCRETVAAKVQPFRADFAHCLKAEQEMPSVHIAPKDFELPKFAKWIDQGDKITKDAYVLMCDPTLPEAKGFADETTFENEPPPTPTGPSADDFELPDDLLDEPDPKPK